MPLDSFSQLATTIRTRLTTPKQMQYFAECTDGGDIISQQTSWRHDCQQEVYYDTKSAAPARNTKPIILAFSLASEKQPRRIEACPCARQNVQSALAKSRKAE